jgi:cobalt/nickel transport protein
MIGNKPGTKHERKGLKLIFTTLLFTLCLLPFALCPAFCAEKWTGVDESVVEKIAGEHGRHAMEPLINTDQGDLLLFVFLAAGAVGGFAAGYYWRVLLEGKGKRSSQEEGNSGGI